MAGGVATMISATLATGMGSGLAEELEVLVTRAAEDRPRLEDDLEDLVVVVAAGGRGNGGGDLESAENFSFVFRRFPLSVRVRRVVGLRVSMSTTSQIIGVESRFAYVSKSKRYTRSILRSGICPFFRHTVRRNGPHHGTRDHFLPS